MFTFNYGVNELNTCSDNEHQLTLVLFYLLYLKKNLNQSSLDQDKM